MQKETQQYTTKEARQRAKSATSYSNTIVRYIAINHGLISLYGHMHASSNLASVQFNEWPERQHIYGNSQFA